MSPEEMVAVAKAIYKQHFTGFPRLREDLIAEGVLGIVAGQEKFDASLGVKPSTYFWKCAKNNMVQFVVRELRWKKVVDSAKETLVQGLYPKRDEFGADDVELARECVTGLRPKTSAIAEEIFDGKKQKEIAQEYGVTRQRVSGIFQTIKRKVTECYDLVGGKLVEKEKKRNEKVL